MKKFAVAYVNYFDNTLSLEIVEGQDQCQVACDYLKNKWDGNGNPDEACDYEPGLFDELETYDQVLEMLNEGGDEGISVKEII